MYYLNEYLININSLNFVGNGEDSAQCCNLPSWANNDSRFFTQTMRRVLESPQISENLHKWLDLIFGIKQRGELAVKSYNTFNTKTLDLEECKTLSNTLKVCDRFENLLEFGNHPKQVFTKEHFVNRNLKVKKICPFFSSYKESEKLILLTFHKKTTDEHSGR
jgi:hypothetical protein